MKYERLTKRNANGEVETVKRPKSSYIQEVYEEWDEINRELKLRLAELEDKIEAGTLVELPCKVGDIVWKAEENVDGLLVYGIVKSIDYKWIPAPKRGEKAVLQTYFKALSPEVFNRVGMGDKAIFGFIFEFAEIGKSVFLTKAEAEKRLEEIRNGNNDRVSE